jgi:2-isopropylmalate synthase
MSAHPASRQRVYLYDTTLRDGAQTRGIDFSVDDKRKIAGWLDEFGFDYIEGGWPGANPTDTTLFADLPPTKQSCFTAFGKTHQAGKKPEDDPSFLALLASTAPAVCLVGKSSHVHVTKGLGLSAQENLNLVASSLRYAKAQGKEVLFDAEHFFDGMKEDSAYTLEVLKTAHATGADWLVLCETNGGALPHEVERAVKLVREALPEAKLGIHAHNDLDCAVANSLAAVRAGCTMVQGTLNGLGERCGNADLVTLLPILALKMGYDVGHTSDNLRDLTALSRRFDHLCDRDQNAQHPFVGEAAFAHKGGLHASAVLKDPCLYEHLEPSTVGNKREILMSNQAGLSNVRAQLTEAGFDVNPKDPRLSVLLDNVKRREADGYAYDRAPASFTVLAARHLGQLPSTFDIKHFSVLTEGSFVEEAPTPPAMQSTAHVLLRVDGKCVKSGETDMGPVHTLDLALRKTLLDIYPCLRGTNLVNYHVRILNTRAGTDATTRVLLETRDSVTQKSWTTVGVSKDILHASLEALMDSYLFKLYCEERDNRGIKVAAS